MCSVAQSCPSLCMDCSPWDSAVHGIFQARRLEWVAISSRGDLPDPRVGATSLASPALAGGLFITGAPWEALPVR